MAFRRIEVGNMRKKVISSVIAGFAACAIIAILSVRPRFQAFAPFECATQFDGGPTTAEERECVSHRVGEAVARYRRGIASRGAAFLANHPDFRENGIAVSNALASCRIELSGGVESDGEVVNLRVTSGNAALACALADFVVRDFDNWLERQATFSFEKNTADDRIALERMKRKGIEPDSIRLDRLETAKRTFERERLKVRPIESARIKSWVLSPSWSHPTRRH